MAVERFDELVRNLERDDTARASPSQHANAHAAKRSGGSPAPVFGNDHAPDRNME